MLKLKATQSVVLSIAPRDAEGNPAQVHGAPTWSVSDPSVGTLEVAEDGLSAKLNAGSPTTGQVNVTADADLGDGTTPITGILDVEVIAGDAVTIEIAAGEPTNNG